MGMSNDGLSYWQSESDGIPLFEISIGDLLDRRAEEIPTQEAIVYSCYPEFGGALDIRLTYREYRERVNAIARGLLALGLNKGDHIAVWAANLPEWPLLELAAFKAGLVLITINPVLRAHEVEYILKQGDVTALFFMARIRDHDCLATMRSLTTPGTKNGDVTGEILPKLRYMSLLGAPPSGLVEQEGWRPTLFREMITEGAQISANALSERQTSVKSTDPGQILNNGAIFARRWGMQQGDRVCTAMPFFHAGGCVLGILAALGAGATLHPLIAFDPLKTLQIISTERCSMLGGVPTMLLAMMQHPDFGTFDLSCLRSVISGGSPVPVYLMEQVKERMGADVAIVFGQTEASAAITLTLQDDTFELKSATVGVPMPHGEVKIINPVTDEAVP